MLNKFASQIEEIAHLSLGPDATLEQVNQDLLAIAERMRESQLTPVAADACPVCHEEYSGACGSCAVGFERG